MIWVNFWPLIRIGQYWVICPYLKRSLNDLKQFESMSSRALFAYEFNLWIALYAFFLLVYHRRPFFSISDLIHPPPAPSHLSFFLWIIQGLVLNPQVVSAYFQLLFQFSSPGIIKTMSLHYIWAFVKTNSNMFIKRLGISKF